MSNVVRIHGTSEVNGRYCGYCGIHINKWHDILCIERYERVVVSIESLAPDTETMKSLEETREHVNRSCRQTVDGSLPGSNQYFQYVALAALIDIAGSLRYFAQIMEKDERRDEEGRE